MTEGAPDEPPHKPKRTRHEERVEYLKSKTVGDQKLKRDELDLKKRQLDLDERREAARIAELQRERQATSREDWLRLVDIEMRSAQHSSDRVTALKLYGEASGYLAARGQGDELIDKLATRLEALPPAKEKKPKPKPKPKRTP